MDKFSVELSRAERVLLVMALTTWIRNGGSNKVHSHEDDSEATPERLIDRLLNGKRPHEL